MADRFIISDTCSPEQRKIFEAINEALEKLGITADEFDTDFRISLMRHSLTTAESIMPVFINALSPDVRKGVLRQLTDERLGKVYFNRYQKEYEKSVKHVGKGGLIKIEPANIPTNPDQIYALTKILRDSPQRVTKDIVNLINDICGRFQDVDLNQLTSEQRKSYNLFTSTLSKDSAAPDETKTPLNFLQEFAGGEPLLKEVSGSRFWEVSGLRIDAPHIPYIIYNSLQSTLMNQANQKGWPEDKYVQELKQLNKTIEEGMKNLSNARAERMKSDTSAVTDITSTSTNFLPALPTVPMRPDFFSKHLASGIPELPIQFYTLDKTIQKPPNEPLPPRFLTTGTPPYDSGHLYLTPACIHRAKMTGEYRLVTFSELAKEFDQAPDSPNSISFVLGSYANRGVVQSKESFKNSLQLKQNVLKLAGVSWKLPDGRMLDMERYYAEAVADADKWAIAYNKQAIDYSTQLYDESSKKLSRKELIQADARVRSAPQFNKKFNEMYVAQIDDAAKALIAHAGVKIIVDYLHETPSDITINEECNYIIIHPEYLDKPNAMALIRDRAVACAMYDKAEPVEIWTLAKSELESKFSSLPSRWRPANQLLGSVVYMLAKKEPERFRALLPVAYQADHEYELRVKEEAYQIMHGLPAPEYKATATAFTINPELPKAQQAYFEQLNAIIEKLGISPAVFDAQFRSGNHAMMRMVAGAARERYDKTLPDAEGKLSAEDSFEERFIKAQDIVEKDTTIRLCEYMLGSNVLILGKDPTPKQISLYEKEKAVREQYLLQHPDAFTPTVAAGENILQSYASGFRLLQLLPDIKVPGTDTIDLTGSHIFQNFITSTLENNIKDSGIQGEDLAEIQGMMENLKTLEKNIFTEPEKKKTAARTIPVDEEAVAQAAEARRLRDEADAQRKAAEAEARAKAAEIAAALVPMPFIIPAAINTFRMPYGRIADLSNSEWASVKNVMAQEDKKQRVLRMRYLHRGEIEPLRELLNTKLPGHEELGKTLFAESVLRRAEYACLPPPPPKEKDRLPSHPDDGFQERSGIALKAFLERSADDIPELQRPLFIQAREKIKERLTHSPALVIAMLGSDEQVRQLREWQKEPQAVGSEKSPLQNPELTGQRNEVAYSLLNAAGIDTPAPQSPPTSPEPPVAAAGAANSGADEPMAQEPEVEKPVVIASIVAAGTEVPKTAIPVVETEMDIKKRAELHADAMEKAKRQLVEEVEAHIYRAHDGEYKFFQCLIDVNDPKLPIKLKFSKEGGDSFEEKLTNHIQYFRKQGIKLTLGDAVDLKIAVQSAVLNTANDFFSSPPSTRRSGTADVGLDTELPADTYNLEKHIGSDPTKPLITEGRGGYSVVIKIETPFKKRKGAPDYLDISIPLGISKRSTNTEESANVQTEIEARKDKVLEILDDVQRERISKGQRISITKREVVYKLRSWIEEQGKSWGQAENLVLEERSKPLLLSQTEGEKGQKITLGPVHLRHDIGGDNPSWRMCLDFYIGDKNQRSMGEKVRTRVVNLHTHNKELAIQRSLESLNGVDSAKVPGKKLVTGFLHHLQDHMNAHPGAEWTVTNQGAEDEEVMIGGKKPLQHFLDDMMRYEHDAGVSIHCSKPDDGNVAVTLTAVRSLTGDYSGTLPQTPEALYIKDKEGVPIPAEATFIIPEDKQDRVADFAKRVQEDMRWFTAEIYSPVALGDRTGYIDGYIQQPAAEDKRKSPQEYRTATIRNALIRSIEAHFQEVFERPLSKRWTEQSWEEKVKDSKRVWNRAG